MRIYPLSLLFFVCGFVFFTSSAQAKSYEYTSIDVVAHINKDTTVRVIETQAFDFNGSFSNAWRKIDMKGIGDITDVSVRDIAINQPVVFTTERSNGQYDVPLSLDSFSTDLRYICYSPPFFEF